MLLYFFVSLFVSVSFILFLHSWGGQNLHPPSFALRDSGGALRLYGRDPQGEWAAPLRNHQLGFYRHRLGVYAIFRYPLVI